MSTMNSRPPSRPHGRWRETEAEDGSAVFAHEKLDLSFTLEEVAHSAGLLAAIAIVADKSGATAEDIGSLVLAVDDAVSLGSVIGTEANQIVNERSQRAERDARAGGN